MKRVKHIYTLPATGTTHRSRQSRQGWAGAPDNFFLSFLEARADLLPAYSPPGSAHAIRPVVARAYIICACAYLISALADLLWVTYSILIGKLVPFHAEYFYVLHTSPFLSYSHPVVCMHFQ